MLTAIALVCATVLAHPHHQFAGTPDTRRAAEALTAAAGEFLQTLDAPLRERAAFPFDADARTDWHYFPRDRAGVSFHDLNPEQERAALGILRAALSESGFETVETIRKLEDVLRALENNNPARDAKAYHFAVFGNPEPGATWAVRFEGHHLSLHWTIVHGAAVASEPQFLGSNPARVEGGELDGARPLGFTEDLGRRLVLSLYPDQRKLAILGDIAPNDILSGTKREAIITEHLGVPWDDLNPSQQAILTRLIKEVAGIHRPELAAARLARIRKAGFHRIKFAWLGGLEPGQGHYYRIQGTTFLFEYDNVQGNANHIHTVWRDFDGDFGRDLLREHYEEHAHPEHGGHDH